MWNDIKEIISTDCNVKKFVFTNPTAVAESVLYKYPTYEDRTVICCSTQSGCPVGCRFCGAGNHFVRSLTAQEIIEQPVYLLERTGVPASKIKRLQIMFMSMGEPLLNYKELSPALKGLNILYLHAALLISTSGPRVNYDNLLQDAIDIPTIGLQFSVHESTDEARDLLIPFKAKLTLQEIAEKGEQFYKATGRQAFFNYCVHDKNNTIADADRLRDLFNPECFQATISVICESDEHVAAANKRQEELAANFTSLLGERGFSTRMFNPAGQSDSCGCGQLWETQAWMRENPDKARPSVGHGRPIVHTPRLEEVSC